MKSVENISSAQVIMRQRSDSGVRVLSVDVARPKIGAFFHGLRDSNKLVPTHF
jgi:hypothetical protein